MFYNDAAPLVLDSGAARVGNLQAFCEVLGVGGEVRGVRLGAAVFSSHAFPQALIARCQRREVVVENATQMNSSCAQGRPACKPLVWRGGGEAAGIRRATGGAHDPGGFVGSGGMV